ncbi:MAG TPA: hypothetical protein V6D07_05640 [Trichocoleus sp.]
MFKKRHLIPRINSSLDQEVSGQFQPLPDLAGLVEGSDAAVPFPDTILYPPHAKTTPSWRWLLIAFASSCAAGGIAIGAFLWLINLPPNVDCENPSTSSTERAQLYCAQVAAESGELSDIVASLELLGQWTPDHPLYSEVQPLVNQWSETTLAAAREKLDQSDLNGAIALINHIPRSSPSYDLAQAELAEWRQDWQRGEAIYAKGQEALKKKDWGTVSNQILALAEVSNGPWVTEKVQSLSRQVRQEKQAQRLLAQAVATAAPGGIDRLSGALRAASQIERDTYTWKEAQPFMDNWSDQLLSVATDKWYAAQLDEAVSLSRRAALNPKREQVAQDLIWLSQARKLALKSVSDWRTSPEQIMGLYQAMLLANQVGPESRFHPQAQSSLNTWKVHLQDLSQIQVAQTIGRFQNREVLKVAIASASAVPPDHPRRQQAQTLVSHWAREIQRIEDRPYLVQAEQLAQAGSIGGLKAAISTASQIQLGRALRPDAQNWIYVWNHQVETLQDQPILNRARAFAAEGNLVQAIAEARLIRADRPLFESAQSEIWAWQSRIRALELAQIRARQAEREALQPKERSPKPETKTSASPEVAPTSTLAPESDPAPQWSEPYSNEEDTDTGRLPTRIETVPAEVLPPIETAPVQQRPQVPIVESGGAPAPLAEPAPIDVQPPAPLAPAPTFQPDPIDFAPPVKGDSYPQSSRLKTEASDEPVGASIVYAGSLYAGW